MPDESSDSDQPRRALAGRLRATRPIGPMGVRSWSRRPYILAAVAVAALLGGAGAALATTGTGTRPVSGSAVAVNPVPSPGLPAPTPGLPLRGGPGLRHSGAFPGPAGLFAALHGQLVVGKPGGGYQTVDVQNGQVTAVSNTSITVRSPDGFTKSYVVAGSTLVDALRDGIGSVKVGNQAWVIATVSGSTATAASITDMTLLQQGHAGFGYWRSASGASAVQTG